MHARLLIADSLEVRRAGALPWLVMLRQAARSSRLLRLCQAATALRLAPCIAAEPGAGPDLTVRAFGAVTQPFAMCDVSKAPPKHHAAPSVKPANPPRSALGQDAKKRAYTTLEEDGVDGVLYPETTAKIGRPAPDFSTEGTVYHPIRRFVHFIFRSSVFRLACPVLNPLTQPRMCPGKSAYRGRRMVLHCSLIAYLLFTSCSCSGR